MTKYIIRERDYGTMVQDIPIIRAELPSLLARQDEQYLELTLNEYIELSDKNTPVLRWKFV